MKIKRVKIIVDTKPLCCGECVWRTGTGTCYFNRFINDVWRAIGEKDLLGFPSWCPLEVEEEKANE
jgi:hypothetical protein